MDNEPKPPKCPHCYYAEQDAAQTHELLERADKKAAMLDDALAKEVANRNRAEEAKDSLARQLSELQALRTEENRELRKMDRLKAEHHELNTICVEQRTVISNQAVALRRLASAHVWED